MRLAGALRRLVGRGTPGNRPAPAPQGHRPPPLPGADSPEIGEMYLRWFVELGDLRPEEAVLEPGCGAGRMARPLSGYLSSAGSYDGFDVMRGPIESCNENIAAAHPNFHFRHVDVLNRAYNPEGRLDPEKFEFPYPDGAFDFAFLTSVFTHMLPPEMRHYLSELRRVLRPGGRCLMTFFLLNDESLDALRAGQASRAFAHEGDGFRYDVPDTPEAAVAHPETNVRDLLAREGFELYAPIRYGYWCGRSVEDPGQDIVIVKAV